MGSSVNIPYSGDTYMRAEFTAGNESRGFQSTAESPAQRAPSGVSCTVRALPAAVKGDTTTKRGCVNGNLPGRYTTGLC